jgi:hypothetical protein
VPAHEGPGKGTDLGIAQAKRQLGDRLIGSAATALLAFPIFLLIDSAQPLNR